MEDSNSGYQFFSALCEKSGIPCISANGKSHIYDIVLEREESDVLVIADGAAFGPEMELLTSLQRFKSIKLFLAGIVRMACFKIWPFRRQRNAGHAAEPV